MNILFLFLFLPEPLILLLFGAALMVFSVIARRFFRRAAEKLHETVAE